MHLKLRIGTQNLSSACSRPSQTYEKGPHGSPGLPAFQSEDDKKLISDPRHPEVGENAWLYYGAGLSPDRIEDPQRVVVHYDGSAAIEYFNPPVR